MAGRLWGLGYGCASDHCQSLDFTGERNVRLDRITSCSFLTGNIKRSTDNVQKFYRAGIGGEFVWRGN
jgi:hypothetical protein